MTIPRHQGNVMLVRFSHGRVSTEKFACEATRRCNPFAGWTVTHASVLRHERSTRHLRYNTDDAEPRVRRTCKFRAPNKVCHTSMLLPRFGHLVLICCLFSPSAPRTHLQIPARVPHTNTWIIGIPSFICLSASLPIDAIT